LLIFYAGHGYWDEHIEQGYWLPMDARSNNQYDWISNSTIRDAIRGLKTKHTLVVSDACFSGSIFKVRTTPLSPNQSFRKIYQRTSRRAMTSGTLKTVPDKSVFAEHFVKQLKSNTANFLDALTLFTSIKDAVIFNSSNFPQYGVIHDAGDEGGDFIFVRR